MSLRIQVDKPGGAVYFPGEILSGEVAVTLDGPVACSSIALTFDGRASILVNNISSNYYSSGMGMGMGYGYHDTTRVHTTTRHVLRNEEVYLQAVIHLAQGMTIPPGTTSFKFSLQLPRVDLPCSFDGPHGSVRYIITARLDQQITSYLHNIMTSLAFIIVPYADLNVSPLVRQFLGPPVRLGAESMLGCCSCLEKPVSVIVTVPHRVFVPGQVISFDVEIKNDSGEPMVNCVMQFVLVITTNAQGEVIPTEQVLNQIVGPAVVKKSMDTWRVNNFGVPNLPPSVMPPTGLGGGCRAMGITYLLRFNLPLTDVSHTNELCVNIPILLGTIALKQ